MQLRYLEFDTSDDTDGRCSFDAMASVAPERLDALQAEVSAVLAWGHRAFGAPGDEAEWDCVLHGTREETTALDLAFDPAQERLTLQPARVPAQVHTTLSLTLSGSAAFGEAFRDAWLAGA